MSKLTDEQINTIAAPWSWVNMNYSEEQKKFARAIESAATEPLLQRIAELEKALKLVQQHHATAWDRGHIAGMAANRMVAQDALNAVKKDAWNNTQLTEALMAAEGRCEELEQRNRDLYEDVQRFKKHALNEKAARLELERQLEEDRKDAERWRFASWHIGLAWGEEGFTSLVRIVSDKHRALINEQVDMLMAGKMPETRAAMQKGQS